MRAGDCPGGCVDTHVPPVYVCTCVCNPVHVCVLALACVEASVCGRMCVCALCADASGQCPAPSVPSLPPPATLARDSRSLEGHCARGAPPVSQRLPEAQAARRAGRWGKGGLPVQGGSPAPPDQPQRGGAARVGGAGWGGGGRGHPGPRALPLAPQVGAAVLGRGCKVQGPRLGAEVKDTRAVSDSRGGGTEGRSPRDQERKDGLTRAGKGLGPHESPLTVVGLGLRLS